MAYPYRSSEVPALADMQLPTDPSFEIIREIKSDPAFRPPTALSLGCHVNGYALPHPDPQDSRTMMDGIKKRFACEMPEPEPQLWAEFCEFVDSWIEENIEPISADADTSVEAWLAKCPYTLARKEQLLHKYREVLDVNDPSYAKVKSFMKDETYPEYKHARAINSRSDHFKAITGPLFRLIDEALFQRPEFVKKISMVDRPDWILDELLMEGAQYGATDFTAYEAHFKERLMDATEFKLYEKLTSLLVDSVWWMPLVRRVLAGENLCVFKWCTIKIKGRRMSGEMCTSSGNGFTNLMLSLFLHHKMGNKAVKIKVEGDDALHRFIGTFPTEELIKKLGLKLKLEVVDDITSASFCGMVFDSTDKKIVTEPVSELVAFGWTTQRYLYSSKKRQMELLRAKSMSMCYQYQGCPILNALGRYGIRVTHGYRARAPITNQYDQHLYDESLEYIKSKGIPSVEPGINTRMLVERLYHIPVQAQIEYEKYLDSLLTLQPLQLGVLEPFASPVWRDYFENYVMCGTKSPFIFPEQFVRTNY